MWASQSAPTQVSGSLVYQVLERPLQPGEATLDELERAFRETPGPAPALHSRRGARPGRSSRR